jgi:predicted nucleic acid-binding protein
VIYLDSSVALARLLSEPRQPHNDFWDQRITSSRLLEYEIWNRLNARGVGHEYEAEVQGLLARVVIVELTPAVLARALKPFPIAVRTLDGLHLASLEYLRAQAQAVALASYDERLLDAARAFGIPIANV